MHRNEGTNRPEEWEELLKQSAWELVVRVGASGGTDLNCYYFAKLSVQLSTHHDKTKMSVSRKPCISRKNYGNFDRILPI